MLLRKFKGQKVLEEEIDELIEKIERAVPHPAITDLIVHPDNDSTLKEIVEKALSYNPTQL